MENSKLFETEFRSNPREIIENLAAVTFALTSDPSDRMWLRGAMALVSRTAVVICTVDNIATALGGKRAEIFDFWNADAEIVNVPATLDGIIDLIGNYEQFQRFSQELSVLSDEFAKASSDRIHLLLSTIGPEFRESIEVAEYYGTLHPETHALFVQAAMSFLGTHEEPREAA
jgi:hypothetical protein